MGEVIYPRDADLAQIPGTLPRKLKYKANHTWQKKLYGSMVEGEDGVLRPAPEKEEDIQAFVNRYAALRGLRRIRVPDVLLRALFAQGGLLDRLVEALPEKMRPTFYGLVMALRRGVKLELGGLPDNIFLDPKRLPDGTHRALVMELKTQAGKVRKSQRMVSQQMGGFHVPRSTDEAKALIDDFVEKGKP